MYSGSSVSLSLDGHRLAVGLPFDDGGVGAIWMFLSNGMTYQPLGSKLVGSGTYAVNGSGKYSNWYHHLYIY